MELVRRVESRALAATSPFALMARAGEAAARLALAVAPHARRVWVACGPGNNGGDGLVCATLLHLAGRRVVVTRTPVDPAREPIDARHAFERARAAGVAFADTPPALGEGDLAIDALLGIGARRAPSGAIAAGVAALNATRATVLALDVPTGLDADTGVAAAGATVVARHTLTFLLAKPGLFTGDGRDHAGRVWLADLGVDLTTDEQLQAGLTRLGGPPVARPGRHRDHKGSLGDVLVVAGARGMAGAADLAATAAHASGAGRVWLHRLDGSALGVAARPEIMALAPGDAADDGLGDAASARTVVAGCGGGTAIAAVLPTLLQRAARLVLDADALNALATDRALAAALRQRTQAGAPVVLTPHPLEAARLLGCTTGDVQSDRPAAARALAAATGAVVLLKGSGTVISRPDGRVRINPTGGPALATPGSGDVLAGWIGGTWAGLPHDGGADAAAASAWWHGRVAERVAAGPLRAFDLVDTMWAAIAHPDTDTGR